MIWPLLAQRRTDMAWIQTVCYTENNYTIIEHGEGDMRWFTLEYGSGNLGQRYDSLPDAKEAAAADAQARLAKKPRRGSRMAEGVDFNPHDE